MIIIRLFLIHGRIHCKIFKFTHFQIIPSRPLFITLIRNQKSEIQPLLVSPSPCLLVQINSEIKNPCRRHPFGKIRNSIFPCPNKIRNQKSDIRNSISPCPKKIRNPKTDIRNSYFPASHSLKSPDRSVLEMTSRSHAGFKVILTRDLL